MLTNNTPLNVNANKLLKLAQVLFIVGFNSIMNLKIMIEGWESPVQFHDNYC